MEPHQRWDWYTLLEGYSSVSILVTAPIAVIIDQFVQINPFTSVYDKWKNCDLTNVCGRVGLQHLILGELGVTFPAKSEGPLSWLVSRNISIV